MNIHAKFNSDGNILKSWVSYDTSGKLILILEVTDAQVAVLCFTADTTTFPLTRGRTGRNQIKNRQC
jgi:hypothetical protein